MFNTFLSGDIILYIFMLLTANMVAETYRSGVMKNIIGRGIAKNQYYLSIVLTLSAAYVLVMLIGSIIVGVIVSSKFGLGAIAYPGYYALSIGSTYSFCDGAHQLCTYNDDLHQKRNYRCCLRPCSSECTENHGNGFGIFENSC